MSDPFSRPTTVYLGGTRAITKSKYGARIFFDTRDMDVGIPLALDGDYEPKLNPWLIGTLRPGDVAVNVGANIGFYAIHFAARVGVDGHVHAFECNPEILRLLRDSIAINYFEERCTIYPLAVTDHEGEVTFHQPSKHLGGGSLLAVSNGEDKYVPIRVQATTLDTVYTGNERPVRLLHIDAEHAEPKIIAGGARFIERHRDMIVVLEVLGESFRSRGDDSIRATLDYLLGTGRILCIIADGQPAEVSVDQILSIPIANVAAIPRHIAK